AARPGGGRGGAELPARRPARRGQLPHRAREGARRRARRLRLADRRRRRPVRLHQRALREGAQADAAHAALHARATVLHPYSWGMSVAGPLGRLPAPALRHIERYPLTADTAPARPVPALLGTDWFASYDAPEPVRVGARTEWWIGRNPARLGG